MDRICCKGPESIHPPDIWLPRLRAKIEIAQLRAVPPPLLTLDRMLWARADTLPVGADIKLSLYCLSHVWATTLPASQPCLCLATDPVDLDLDPDSRTDYLAWSWTCLITTDLSSDHCLRQPCYHTWLLAHLALQSSWPLLLPDVAMVSRTKT